MANGLNKKYIGLMVGAILLILIFVFFFSNRTPQSYQSNTQDQSASTPTPAPAPEQTTGKLSYSQAIAKYKYRYQFVSCHANPGSMAVAKNDPVMFDNRDNKSHIIKVGSQSFGVSALNYEIFYPSVKGSYNITCDGGGSATLKVE